MAKSFLCLPILGFIVLCLSIGCAHTEDYTQGKNSKCQVHALEMIAVILPAKCGHEGVDVRVAERTAEYSEAKKKLFPHANGDGKEVAIGECFTPESKVIRKAKVWECPQCRKAKFDWVNRLK